ncbi:MAG TPA: outer membrane protein transport protein [Pseudolabrys sp.]|jgi:long-chain fatty acid transport protein|nr:outer membrane protein transport protein [Pseudolabrys sp.]
MTTSGRYAHAVGAFAALLMTTAAAHAGGFAIREMSAYGQGSSFAGVAAGGALSSLFWNPATMTQMPGVQTEFVATGAFGSATHTVDSASTLAVFGGAPNSARDALVPSGYFSWQVNPRVWLGLSFNSPFGLSVGFPDVWAGRDYAESTSLKTYNATPSVAVRITDWLSIGAGVQIQYANANFSSGIGATPGAVLNIGGTGWGYGLTAGITVTPTPTTMIGLGWRSAIDQKIDGSLSLPAGPVFNPPFSTPGSVNTTINLPDVVSLGIRQKVTPQLTLLGTVEWSNWSRIGTSVVTQANGAPALVLNGLGGGAVALPFRYSDGWLYSLGAEYQWDPRIKLRAGVAYEKSPITDDVRTPRLPDNDRYWVSAGLSYNITKALAFDLAYSHIFVKSTSVAIAPGNPWFNGAVTYFGNVDSDIDLLSIGLRYQWM